MAVVKKVQGMQGARMFYQQKKSIKLWEQRREEKRCIDGLRWNVLCRGRSM